MIYRLALYFILRLPVCLQNLSRILKSQFDCLTWTNEPKASEFLEFLLCCRLKSGLKCTKIFSILRSIFWVILAFFALHYISKTVRHLEESKAISAHNSEMLEEISVNSILAVPLVQSHDFVTTIHPEQSELVDEAKSLNVCFLYGACKESHFIEAKSMDTLQNCMTQCNQDPRCEYVTFNFELLMCQLHETKCKAISSTGCRNCLTSAKHCPYSVPCQVKGQCQGTLEFAMFANAKDCHRICAENEKCLWYSYDQNRCFVFSSCDQIIDYNSSTITQHYSCKPIGNVQLTRKFRETFILTIFFSCRFRGDSTPNYQKCHLGQICVQKGGR